MSTISNNSPTASEQITPRDWIEVCKPKIGLLVVITAFTGCISAAGTSINWSIAFITCLGTFISCCGSAVLNNYLERDVDGLMNRTKTRASASGKIDANTMLLFGIALSLLGVSILAAWINLLTAFIALLTVFLYVLVYTPLKRVTWLNTIIGAIPGALPPVGGVTSFTNSITLDAIFLFAVLFVWQMPHFFSIAWLLKDDYTRGGFQMLPSIEKDGKRTAFHVMAWSIGLMVLFAMPLLWLKSYMLISVATLLFGYMTIKSAQAFHSEQADVNARKVLRASLVVLPGYLLAFAIAGL